MTDTVETPPQPRPLDTVSDEVILSLEFTPRDYLDRVYGFSQRLLELSFKQDQTSGKSFFTLSNEIAIEEAQIHVAMSHDPIRLEAGSITAGAAMKCVSVWHMAQRYLILRELENNPPDEPAEENAADGETNDEQT
jgi:hypothetical protein